MWKSILTIVNKAVNERVKQLQLRPSEGRIDTAREEVAANSIPRDSNVIYLKLQEESLEMPVYVGMAGPWAKMLARTQLDMNDTPAEEVRRDLVAEFLGGITKVVTKNLDLPSLKLSFRDPEIFSWAGLQQELDDTSIYLGRLVWDSRFRLQEQNDDSLSLVLMVSNEDVGRIDERLETMNIDPDQFKQSWRERIQQKVTQPESKYELASPPQNGSNGKTVESQRVEFENFDKSNIGGTPANMRNLDLLQDVDMDLSVEIGRKKMSLGEILKLVKGSVIELDKLAGDPVEIMVNGHPIAQGEVVVIEEHFGVRISNLVSLEERIKGLY